MHVLSFSGGGLYPTKFLGEKMVLECILILVQVRINTFQKRNNPGEVYGSRLRLKLVLDPLFLNLRVFSNRLVTR